MRPRNTVLNSAQLTIKPRINGQSSPSILVSEPTNPFQRYSPFLS